MPNKRISELEERTFLKSNCNQEILFGGNSSFDSIEEKNENINFLLAREKVRNENINYKQLKSSLIDNSLCDHGTQTIQGEKSFVNDVLIQGIGDRQETEEQSLIHDGKIKKINKEDINFDLQEDSIALNSTKSIIFDSIESRTSFSDSGCFNIDSVLDKGALSVAGESFIEKVYLESVNKRYYKLIHDESQLDYFFQDDETVCFKYKLNINQTNFDIQFPKVFKERPILSLSLQCEFGYCHFLPLAIRSVDEHHFKVEFASKIPAAGYVLQVVASSPSWLDERGVGIVSNPESNQRFITHFSEPAKRFTIRYPFEHQNSPIIHACIEMENNVVPYSISSVNNISYDISFATTVNQNFSVHTFTQEQLTS